MKKNLFLYVTIALMAFSCSKSDNTEITPIRDYAVQYTTDIDLIKIFLKTHSITVTNHAGFVDDQDVSFTVVPELSSTSIWGTDAATHNANLLEHTLEKDGITYTIYYLQLRQGLGATSKSPCNLDGVLTAYKGRLMDTDMTVFDSNDYPQTYFSLSGVIRGWSEIFPKFKTGSYTSNPVDGTITYSDFGAGVMFIPSGLGYYSNSLAEIPAYSPLIFNFKLYEVQRVDNDGDGIYSYQEDINGDGYIRDNDTTYEDDTDNDGTPDAIDIDDDGDQILTKEERRTTPGGLVFYDFDLIPVCPGGNGKKRYLDPSCH
jgi:FKBP-type peptidyl-prolyl cis-trans isomerase